MAIKVLIIDDDSAIIELLSILLKNYDVEVISANNSITGLDMVKSTNPDVILLDLLMSEKNGWDVCREIRTFSQTPIVILSALNDPAMVASALDAGADDYLVKPVPTSELLSHINKLTRRAVVEKNGGKTMMHQTTGSLVRRNGVQLRQKPLQA